MQPLVFRGVSIFGWDLEVDALGSTKKLADMADVADVGRVDREYHVAANYVCLCKVVMGKRDICDALEQNNPFTPGYL